MKHQVSSLCHLSNATLVLSLIPILLATNGYGQDAPSPKASVTRYQVKKGDTLMGISRHTLGDVQYWKSVKNLNKIKIPKHIQPGQQITLPKPVAPNTFQVSYIHGVLLHKNKVQIQAAKVGDAITAGDELFTQENSYAAITQSNGSKLMLYPLTHTKLEATKINATDASAVTRWSLITGRTKAEITPQGANRFRIYTPIAIAGVRGTQFRLSYDQNTKKALNEVLEGTVWLGKSPSQTTDVHENFGIIASNQGITEPKALLNAPSWQPPPDQITQNKIISLTPIPEAAQYQITLLNKNTNKPIQLLKSKTPEFNLGELPNGEYQMELTASDADGLEGKVRQEPLIYIHNPIENVVAQKLVTNNRTMHSFSWDGDPNALFTLELAADPDFENILWSWPDSKAQAILMSLLPAAHVYWRVKSTRTLGHYKALKISPTQSYSIQ